MKLATDVPLRKDGTVTATVPGEAGQPTTGYVFRPDDSGQTTADVDCEEHVAWLLDTGFFFPADEADTMAGVAAVAAQNSGDADESVVKEGPAPKPAKKKRK